MADKKCDYKPPKQRILSCRKKYRGPDYYISHPGEPTLIDEIQAVIFCPAGHLCMRYYCETCGFYSHYYCVKCRQWFFPHVTVHVTVSMTN